MNDLTVLGVVALFAAASWLLVVLCGRLRGETHERK
jgi:hypothetical protein